LQNIQVDFKLYLFKNKIVNKNIVNQLLKDFLVGTLLGDGNFHTNNGQTWRLRVLHSADQVDYLKHKYFIVKDFCTSEPSYSSVFDHRTQNTYHRYSFNTVYSDEFRFLGQCFYKKENLNGKVVFRKVVPKQIKKLLTARALAYWYMDDGSLKWKGKSNALRICTDNFLEHEVKLLKSALETNFNLKVSLQKQNDKYRLYILEESSLLFRSLILPYIIPSMKYKLVVKEIHSDIKNLLT